MAQWCVLCQLTSDSMLCVCTSICASVYISHNVGDRDEHRPTSKQNIIVNITNDAWYM